jgi:hypothetical protein
MWYFKKKKGFLKPAKGSQENQKGNTRTGGMTAHQGGKAKVRTLWESGFRKIIFDFIKGNEPR